MNSSLIGKIEKARRYAEERERVQFSEFTASVAGDNDTYLVQYRDGGWHCTCNYFLGRGLCCHTMALEKILEGMMSAGSSSREAVPAAVAI